MNSFSSNITHTVHIINQSSAVVDSYHRAVVVRSCGRLLVSGMTNYHIGPHLATSDHIGLIKGPIRRQRREAIVCSLFSRDRCSWHAAL